MFNKIAFFAYNLVALLLLYNDKDSEYVRFDIKVSIKENSNQE